MTVHDSARGFERSTSSYDRGRPEYPPEAATQLLDRIGVTSESRVLELGAGTGKFTRFLAARTPHLVASDPSPAMRKALSEKFPAVHCLAAQAESLPTVGHCFDAVVCAQAFHWFGHTQAVLELARVLVKGGYLGLIWNVRDEDVGWVAALTEIMDPYSGDTPRYRSGDWKTALAQAKALTPLEQAVFRQVVHCDRETVVDRVASVSFIAALPDHLHRQVLKDVTTLVATHPDTRGRDRLDFPYRTDVYWCRKR
jgi:SAM-dependent methyltransferase